MLTEEAWRRSHPSGTGVTRFTGTDTTSPWTAQPAPPQATACPTLRCRTSAPTSMTRPEHE